MINTHSFSALDRHAVLSGPDNGFSGYAGGMLVNDIVLIGGYTVNSADDALDREAEAQFRLIAKIFAVLAAVANWLEGETSFFPRADRA
jgi:hypothetical protein